MQRVALARALVKRPQVLLLDEPLSALDLKIRLEMEVELRRVHRETGATWVYVTHDQREALALSDRIASSSTATSTSSPTRRRSIARPATPYAAGFVGNANVLACEVDGRPPERGSCDSRRRRCRSATRGSDRPGVAGPAARERLGRGRRAGRPGAGGHGPRRRLPRDRFSYARRAGLEDPIKAEVPRDAGASARDRLRGRRALGRRGRDPPAAGALRWRSGPA